MRLFCFGLGYSAEALVRLHHGTFASVAGTVRNAEKAARLRGEGVEAHVHAGGAPTFAAADALRRADALLVSAPPDADGDPMLKDFGGALARADRLSIVVYLSTVGVYGDHGGDWVDEATPAAPVSERGRRRLAAEEAWAAFGAKTGAAVQLHRLAGIYGPGRNALEDLKAGVARRIVKPGQAFNRIHVEDIAGAAAAGLARADVAGPINVCDDEPAPPQDVVAFAAGLLGAPAPPEIPFEQADLSEMGRSFYAENKRCRNLRLKGTLGYRLRHPTYREGLRALLQGSRD